MPQRSFFSKQKRTKSSRFDGCFFLLKSAFLYGVSLSSAVFSPQNPLQVPNKYDIIPKYYGLLCILYSFSNKGNIL